MTGIGRELLYSYSSAKTDRVPKNIKQQIAGFVSNDEEKKPGADVSKIRRALRTGAKELASEAHVSVIDDMKLYSKALKKQRETAKDTALEKKKVRFLLSVCKNLTLTDYYLCRLALCSRYFAFCLAEPEP